MKDKYLKISALPLVIVVGNPRSGTNMLRGFMDAHPNIMIPSEFPFIVYYSWYFKKKEFLSADDVNFLCDLLDKPFRFKFWTIKRWRIDEEKLRSNLLDAAADGDLTYSIACKIIIYHCVSIYDKSEIKFLALKEPFYSTQVKDLKKIFPDLKFVWIHRDPRGQINSLRKQAFGSKLITFNSMYWNKVQRDIYSFRKSNVEDFFTVKYEDMVDDPKLLVQNLFAFMELPFVESAMDYQSKRGDFINELGDKKIELKAVDSALSKPDINKISEWKKQLSKFDIKIIELLNFKMMKKLGYQKVFCRNELLWIIYLPAFCHALLQKILYFPVSLLPTRKRLNVMLRPSLFEGLMSKIFRKN